MDILKEKLGVINVGKVLDVGTGAGSFISILEENLNGFDEIIGIDNSERAINVASGNFKNEKIKFMIMDGTKTNFEDQTFDVVCISNTLHHLADPIPTLNEMKRVLKDDGIFIIMEMFCDNQDEKQMNHVKIHHLAAEMDRLRGVVHKDTYKKNEIIELLKNNLSEIKDEFEVFFGEETIPPEEFEKFKESELKRVEMIKDHPEYNNIKDRIIEVIENIRKIGVGSATELVIIGKK